MTVAFRHVYTSATAGALGVTGFQTVAASADIWQRDEVRRRIEGAVSNLRPPEDVTVPIHQVVPVPWPSNEGGPGAAANDRWLFSRAVHAQPTPSQRSGNFLVESFLVPETWPGTADWDLDAAIHALPWRGAAYRHDVRGDDKLPSVQLPEVLAGSLDRLEAVAALPDPIRRQVVEAVVGLNGGRSATRLVSSRRLEPPALEELLRVLPLLLPPPCRWTYDFNLPEGRPLSLRSFGDGDRAQHAVDLDATLHSPPRSRPRHIGRLVRLDGENGGTQQPSSPEAAAYVEWLARLLEARDWPRLRSLFYEHRSRDLPSSQVLRRLDWRAEPLAPATASLSQELQSALDERQALWEFRQRAEIMMKNLEAQMSRELDELQQAFRTEADRLLETHRRQMAEAREEQSSILGDMKKTHQQMMQDLAETRNRTIKELQVQQEKDVADFKRYLAKHEERMKTLVDSGEDRGAPRRPRTAGRGPVDEDGWLSRLTETRWLAVMVVLGLITGIGFGWLYLRPADSEAPPLASASSGDTTTNQEGGDAPQDPVALQEDLLERLSKPAVASAVLSAAMAGDATRSSALDLTLEARLALRREALPKKLTCALLQAAVGTGVDGGCGDGSLAAARAWKPKNGTAPAADAGFAVLAPMIFEQELEIPRQCLGEAWPQLKMPDDCVVRFAAWKKVGDKIGAGVPERAVLTALLAESRPVNLNAGSAATLGKPLAGELLKLAHRAYAGSSKDVKLADLKKAPLTQRLAELDKHIADPAKGAS